MRHLYFVFLSLALSLQLIGCATTQPSSSSEGAHPDTAVLSVAQSSAQSSRAPVATGSKPSTETSSVAMPAPQAPPATGTPSQPTAEQTPSLEQSAPAQPMEENSMIGVTLQVDGKVFSATLVNHEAGQAFLRYLPMTVEMSDLNGQEKFYNLPDNLPSTSTVRPSTINSGDIMCWSGNTLVLFYSTFQNSYGGYVRLGTVDDPDGLAAALGSGSAQVTWTHTQ